MSKDELDVASSEGLIAKQPQTTFSQVGDKNIQIAHAERVNNFIILPMVTRTANNPALLSNLRLNTDYYNLFVIGEEVFDGSPFIVPRDRALTESTEPDIKAKYATLSEEAIEQIKTFPALFASENRAYARTDNDHVAFFGVVTDVKKQDNGIKIYYSLISPLQQQRLNELTFKLAIGGTSSFNELNRTHWAIKRINLWEELTLAGLIGNASPIQGGAR